MTIEFSLSLHMNQLNVTVDLYPHVKLYFEILEFYSYSRYTYFRRTFRRMDEDGNKTLNPEEFKAGLEETGMELSDDEINAIFEKFDTDEDGSITIDEFLVGIRVSFFFVFNLCPSVI